MSKHKNLIVEFHIEPADRSVGIMSEGFSAWVLDGDCWCEVEQSFPFVFQWYDNETGDKRNPPNDSVYIEEMLKVYVKVYYSKIG